jgi:hypothetical protein
MQSVQWGSKNRQLQAEEGIFLQASLTKALRLLIPSVSALSSESGRMPAAAEQAEPALKHSALSFPYPQPDPTILVVMHRELEYRFRKIIPILQARDGVREIRIQCLLIATMSIARGRFAYFNAFFGTSQAIGPLNNARPASMKSLRHRESYPTKAKGRNPVAAKEAATLIGNPFRMKDATAEPAGSCTCAVFAIQLSLQISVQAAIESDREPRLRIPRNSGQGRELLEL